MEVTHMEVSLERLTHLFLHSPQGQALQAQQTTEDARQALFVKRTTLQHQQATELPPLAKEVERAARELDAERAVMQEKQDAYDLAASAYTQHRHQLDAQLTHTEGKLRFSASALIDQFITDCWRRHEEVRNNDFHAVPARGEYNLETGRNRLEMVTNADTISARLKALRQAAQTAEGLKLGNLTDEEVRARLAALKPTGSTGVR
jgi:formyltetrahydrofolate hydrolase